MALMLHARGIDCQIFEAAPEVRELGVGINVLPHAIRELAEIGLLPALDATGIRTRELIYATRQGQEIWREPRGVDAGYDVPQFSIHRGYLQKLLYNAVIERLGPDAVIANQRCVGYTQNEGSATVHFAEGSKLPRQLPTSLSARTVFIPSFDIRCSRTKPVSNGTAS